MRSDAPGSTPPGSLRVAGVADWTAEVRARAALDGAVLPPDVIEEIGQHIADLHRAALFRGQSLEQADAAAAAELSNINAIAGAIRRRRLTTSPGLAASTRPWTGIGHDVHHAWRLLLAKRGYSSVIVLTLAIGVGACTAVFSLANALLMGPLPFPQPERLVLLWETLAEDTTRHFTVSAPNYRDWVAGTRSFAALGLWEHLSFNVAADAAPQQVPGVRASSSLFDVLGVAPALGRTFTPAEERPGHAVAVISDGVWQAHFGGDAAVIGKPIRLNGLVHEVIGVLPPGFAFPSAGIGIWVPVAFSAQDLDRSWHSFRVAGRLADGVALEQGRAEVERLGAALRVLHKENADEGATVQLMSEAGVATTKRILLMLSGAVALVLLIACVNAASLQLAFGLSRRRELVTRLALGARYAHLMRQLLVESAVLASFGCAAGIALAFAITGSVDSLLGPGFRTLPFRGEVTIGLDAWAMAFAVAVTALSTVVFAFAPLRGIRQQALQPAMREGDRGATRFAAGTRRVLVTIEIALAIVVLCGAGLMVRSLATLLNVNPGLDPSNVLVMQVSLPQPDPEGPPARPSFCADLSREAAQVPGVRMVSAINYLPLAGANSDRFLTIEGGPQVPMNQGPYADFRVICPDYFAALGIPRLAGREFGAHDTPRAPQVAVVNRAFVERYVADGTVLNKRIKLGGFESTNAWITIVGVVDNVRHFGLEEAPTPELYRPYSQAASPVMTVIAKTVSDPLAWQRPMREALTRVEPLLPASNTRTMTDVVARSVAWRQTPMRLLSAFAIVGLVLAGLGVYGVLAFYVSQRTREFGIRAALGASKAMLIGLVLRQSAWPLLIGAALGIAGSIASGQLLAGLLYEVEPGDPVVIGSILAVLTAVSLLSSWLPARRAALVDPLTALRDE